MPSGMHQTEKEIQGGLTYMWNQEYNKTRSHRYKECNGDCQKSGVGRKEGGWEKCVKVITRYSHQINKS